MSKRTLTSLTTLLALTAGCGDESSSPHAEDSRSTVTVIPR